jgi:predicted branched-subunit amino acid permease
MNFSKRSLFVRGLRDGIPIFLGYLAVGFTLGIAAKRAGLTAFQAGLASFLTNASAGQYAGFTVIAEGGTYLEIALMILVANARYLLMSCALTQKLGPEVGLGHRMLIGFDVTDEIFGVCIGQEAKLSPYYAYGVICAALPGWSGGTALGVLVGNLLPGNLVSALSVGLYGMFLAVIIPPSRKDKVVCALVVLSMALSFLVSRLSIFSGISSGTKIILLTVLISAGAALLFPRKEEAAKA